MKLKSIQPELGAILLNIKQIATEVNDSGKSEAERGAFEIHLQRIKTAVDAMERLNE